MPRVSLKNQVEDLRRQNIYLKDELTKQKRKFEDDLMKRRDDRKEMIVRSLAQVADAISKTVGEMGGV